MKSARIVVSFGALVLCAVLARAQGAPDFSKVEIKANKVTDKFYTLDGQGGTIGVLFGPDGVFMVDTQFAPLSDKIAAAIKRSPRSRSSSSSTRTCTATTPAATRTSARWARRSSRAKSCAIAWRIRIPGERHSLACRCRPPACRSRPIAGMLTMHMNGEEIQLIAVPRAHTDGDTMVYFPGLDVIMTGDFYRSIQYPERRSRQRRVAAGPDGWPGRGDRARRTRTRRSFPDTGRRWIAPR